MTTNPPTEPRETVSDYKNKEVSMKTNKRRLLKDLPFGDLKSGTVIWKGSRGVTARYTVTNKTTYYQEGGSSDGGIVSFDHPSADDILDTIWDNPDWFEDAIFEHIDIIITDNSHITLAFKSVDYGDVEMIAKAIQHHIMLKLKEDGGYIWRDIDVTTSILSQPRRD